MADYRRNTIEANGGRIRNHTMSQNYQGNRLQNTNYNHYSSTGSSRNEMMVQNHGYTYTSGNTVRKVDPVYIPPIKEPEKKSPEKRTRRRQAERPKKRAEQGVMTAPYLIFLTAVSCMLLFTSYQYLSIRSDVSSKVSAITNQQRNVSNLKMDNDATLGIVNQTVNMESVKQRAEELGMAFMEKEQVMTYKATSGDVMKQYNDIPSSGVVAQYERAYE